MKLKEQLRQIRLLKIRMTKEGNECEELARTKATSEAHKHALFAAGNIWHLCALEIDKIIND